MGAGARVDEVGERVRADRRTHRGTEATGEQAAADHRRDDVLELQPDALVGLHANYRVNQHWNAKLTVNNLFDKRYYDNFVIFRARYGAPRNVHLSIDYQW